jgi:hypothetical protein
VVARYVVYSFIADLNFIEAYLEFNEKANTISWIAVRSEEDELFDPRVNAAAALLDNTLFVYGSSSLCVSSGFFLARDIVGGSDESQILDDLSVLTLETCQYPLAQHCLKV